MSAFSGSMIIEEDTRTIADIGALLADRGLSYRAIEILSPLASGRKANRRTLRVTLANGSTIKVRCLENPQEASRLTMIRRLLDPAFAPVVDHHGAVLLETWVDGEQLTLEQAAGRAEDLGAMLGRLHGTRLPTQQYVETGARCQTAIDQLRQLGDAGLVTAEARDALQQQLRELAPRRAPMTVVHMDYCPENLVIDALGGLHVIDNEWIRVDAPGLDLGRTYSRWPMTESVWTRFLGGYLTTAPFDPGPLRFWMIVMAAAGATIRLQKSPAEQAAPLARLRQLAVT
jgi:hypothetical protein